MGDVACEGFGGEAVEKHRPSEGVCVDKAKEKREDPTKIGDIALLCCV